MKESYGKGLANHPGPKLCGDGGNSVAEALVGVHAGWVSSSEIHFPVCRPCHTLLGSHRLPTYSNSNLLSCFLRQHFLNFFPLPQGQGSLRPTLLRAGCSGSTYS